MKRKLQFYALFMLMMAVLVISNSCNATFTPTEPLPPDQPYPVTDPDSSPPAPTPSEEDAPAKGTPASNHVTRGEQVYVDSMDIFIQESFPVQISVQVYGNLPDGCTSIENTAAVFDGKDTFTVHIYTTRPTDMMCTQALVPFEENIPLDVEGLPAGNYTVIVYDLESTFTLDVENK